MTTKESSTPRDQGLVYLCRASGEGSHDFRVCANDVEVFAFYEEMCGRDQDGTLTSITDDFYNPDAWSHEGQAYDIKLYCARFEVWKVPAKDLQTTPSEIRERDGAGNPVVECPECNIRFDPRWRELSGKTPPSATGEFKGWAIRNTDGRWRTMDTIGMPDYTDDQAKALVCRLREHIERYAEDDPDDIRIIEVAW